MPPLYAGSPPFPCWRMRAMGGSGDRVWRPHRWQYIYASGISLGIDFRVIPISNYCMQLKYGERDIRLLMNRSSFGYLHFLKNPYLVNLIFITILIQSNIFINIYDFLWAIKCGITILITFNPSFPLVSVKTEVRRMSRKVSFPAR